MSLVWLVVCVLAALVVGGMVGSGAARRLGPDAEERARTTRTARGLVQQGVWRLISRRKRED
jgi:hypothetical protein